MQDAGSIVELARMAAAAARTEWAARVAARRPVRKYRGVHQRNNRFYAVIWNSHTGRMLWLGSYATPEEAAYAFDAAARVMHGHRARLNFPEPAAAWVPAAAPAREVVSTDPVLALPTPAVPARRRDLAATVAAQVSFDNWWLAGAAAAAGPQPKLGAPAAVAGQATAAAAAADGSAAIVVNPSPSPSNPGNYGVTSQNVHRSSINPASTTLSCTDPDVAASLFLPAAAPTHLHREQPVSQASEYDPAVVEDNFELFTIIDTGATSSAAPARPPVARLKLDLRLRVDLPGRGGRSREQ